MTALYLKMPFLAGIRFKGTDLHQGFNILLDDFRTFLEEEAHLVWWHLPYWDMIRYSGYQWSQPDKWDMSHMSLPEFVEVLELAVVNIHDACEKGGHCGILMGNLRRNGEYFNLPSLVERIAPGKLVDEGIKIQHNCVSDSTVEKLCLWQNKMRDGEDVKPTSSRIGSQ